MIVLKSKFLSKIVNMQELESLFHGRQEALYKIDNLADKCERQIWLDNKHVRDYCKDAAEEGEGEDGIPSLQFGPFGVKEWTPQFHMLIAMDQKLGLERKKMYSQTLNPKPYTALG